MTLLVPLKNTPFRGLNLRVPPMLTWAGFDSNKVHILIGFTMKDPSAVSIGYLSLQCINRGLKTGHNCRSCGFGFMENKDGLENSYALKKNQK